MLAILILTMTFVSVNAQKRFTADGIAYQTTSDNTVKVTSGENKVPSGGTYTGDITIPSTVTSSGVTYSITSIEKNAFYNCTGLKSITLPSTIELIGEGAFSGCSGLTSVALPPELRSIENEVFESCSGLKSVTIPSKVQSIGVRAFSQCELLTTVEIPSSVEKIEQYAFTLTSLENIKIHATTPPSLFGEPFTEIDANISVYVPASAVDSYKNDADWKYFTNIVGMKTE